MNNTNALQDTYYVVYHSWWVTASLVVLVVLIAVLFAIRRWSTSRRAATLARYALWILIIGQILATGTALASHFVFSSLSTQALLFLGVLNIALGLGMALTILSLLLTVFALITALRHR